MDSDHKATNPDPATKGPALCRHIWTQLTPTQAQCQTCGLTVPTKE